MEQPRRAGQRGIPEGHLDAVIAGRRASALAAAAVRAAAAVAARARARAHPLAGAACLLAFAVLAVGNALAQPVGPVTECGVKAAFIYKFLAYAEWPPSTFARPDQPIVVGVVGADDVQGELAEVVRGRRVGERPVDVRRLRAADSLEGVNVLFVGAAERARIAPLARAAQARGTLLISETDDALDQGSAINLVVVDGRVRFEVALDAAERAGIKLSSRLLGITTGKLSLRTDLVDLDAVLRAAVDTARPIIEARRHVLTISLPKRPVTLEADATRLAQVFSNLLNNAAKFTSPGGRIDVRVGRDSDQVTVRVVDNGIGIAPAMLGHVFEMFTQADHALERVHAGLGVGLTLARRLVELHGGTLEADSAGVGTGSQFIVRLPIAPAQAKAAPRTVAGPGPPPEPGATSGRRVLVVDDNQDFANSLALILRAQDNEVRVAQDGAAALALARDWRPEIGFLDIGLPMVNGYELARRLRGDAATAAMRLVAVTGWGQDKDRQRALDAGFDRHLVKPVEPAHVLDLMGALTPRG